VRGFMVVATEKTPEQTHAAGASRQAAHTPVYDLSATRCLHGRDTAGRGARCVHGSVRSQQLALFHCARSAALGSAREHGRQQ